MNIKTSGFKCDKTAWKTVRLGEICKLCRGVRVVRSQLSHGKYTVYQNSLIPLGKYDRCNTPPDTTFIIAAGSAGEIGYSQEQFWAADDCYYLIPNDGVASKFLFYSLLGHQSQISGSVRRGSVPRLARDVIGNLGLHLPEGAIQHKITDALSAVDTQIIALQQLLSKYESIKKATVKKLMTPTSEWQTTTIENIANVVTGATPSTSVPEYWDNATIPWMSSGEINNRFITNTENRISQLGYDRTSTHLIRPNSILVALAGQGTTRGKVAINRIELCTNQSLAAITPFRPKDYGFVFWNLDSRYNELRSISAGDGGRGGLNLHLIKTLPIELPEEKTRDRISSQLFSFSQFEDKLHNQMLKLTNIKQFMLQYFFG